MRLLGEWGRGRVDGLAWSPVGSLMAVTTPLGAFLYNPSRLAAPLQLQTGAAASRPVFSPDGRYLALDVALPWVGTGAPAPQHAVQVWDLGSGDPLLLPALETGGQALALAYQETTLLALVRDDAGAQIQRWEFAVGSAHADHQPARR